MSVKSLLDLRQSPQWGDWRWQWRNRATNMSELRACLPGLRHISEKPAGSTDPHEPNRELEGESEDRFEAYGFRFGVTPYYLSLARPEDPNCPILKQTLPDERELRDSLFYRPDPLAEEDHMPVRGLTHRYPDRVLWYISHNCAVYCRFCMRKRKVSRADSAPVGHEWEAALLYIETHPEIQEVILSGGDPLSVPDRRLDELLTRLRKISHLYSVRIHTRMPVTMPMRITPELCEIFERHYPLTLVTHFNHARELSPEAAAAIKRLRMAGVLVLNQAVLLAGINDTVAAQKDLHLGLVKIGVKPYYLHQLDEVRGVSHFRVPIEKGLAIMAELQGRNPGIALPKYMIDLPGGGGKVPLENRYLVDGGGDSQGRVIRNWAGREFKVVE